MNKVTSIIVTIALVFVLAIIFINDSKSKNSADTATNHTLQNSMVKDGVQYITISAKNGYSPKISLAKAGIPTKLIVKTSGTYDCSTSLAIHSIGFRKILPQTGETEIDLGTKKIGEVLQGVCGMGMFSFQITFS